jgi:hypothetical protein
MRRRKVGSFRVLSTAATEVRTRCLKTSYNFREGYLKTHLSEIFDARIGDGEACPQNHNELDI